MKIRIEWQEPILVARHKRLVNWQTDADAIEALPGVYFFSRQHGKARYPFYIGETLNLCARLKQHMKTVAIVDVLRGIRSGGNAEISQGARYFHFGYLRPTRGQQAKKCLAIAQKYMIQAALQDGCPILNKQLTAIRTHELEFDGTSLARGIYPKGPSARE